MMAMPDPACSADPVYSAAVNGSPSSRDRGLSMATNFPRPRATLQLRPGSPIRALGTPTLSSGNIAPTKAAIQRYQAIVAQGGWPMVPATAMKPGSRGPEIATAASTA